MTKGQKTSAAGTSLRQRRHLQIVEDAQRAAIALFLEKGYDETSMRDISEAIGVSERTLFRHVPTKESFLLREMHKLSHAIFTRMADVDASIGAVDAYRKAAGAFVEMVENAPEHWVALVGIIDANTGLRAEARKNFGRDSLASQEVADEIATRLGTSSASEEVRLLQSFLIAAVLQAEYDWKGDPARDLGAMVDRNLELIEPVEAAIRRRLRGVPND